VCGSLSQTQPTLPPHNAGDLRNQMFLCRALRRVLGDERCHDRLIFVGVLPRQHGVARQHAVPQGVEAVSSVLETSPG
jgi:hypothetical protein